MGNKGSRCAGGHASPVASAVAVKQAAVSNGLPGPNRADLSVMSDVLRARTRPRATWRPSTQRAMDSHTIPPFHTRAVAGRGPRR